MESGRPRRVVLAAAGAIGLPAVAGCFGGFGSFFGMDEGDLHVENEDAELHAVTVTVTKMSDDPDGVTKRRQTPDPDATPVWTREYEFQLEPGTEVTKPDVVVEAGTYYVEAEMERGERGYVMTDTPEGGREVVVVTVSEDGTVGVSLFGQ